MSSSIRPVSVFNSINVSRDLKFLGIKQLSSSSMNPEDLMNFKSVSVKVVLVRCRIIFCKSSRLKSFPTIEFRYKY